MIKKRKKENSTGAQCYLFLRRLVPFVELHGHYGELFVVVHPKLNKASHFKNGFKVATVSERVFGLIFHLARIKKTAEFRLQMAKTRAHRPRCSVPSLHAPH